MLARALNLQTGELARLLPFFGLYLLLFLGLTLADGLSLALFVARVGASQLPAYQGWAAVGVMITVAWYLFRASSWRADRVFYVVLLGPALLFLGVWVGLQLGALGTPGLGLLFVGREVAFTFVLLHFGAYLQDYFTRAELSRVMPIIYAGGRFGGIGGGMILASASVSIGPTHLLVVLAGLLALSLVAVAVISRSVTPVEEPTGPSPGSRPNPGEPGPDRLTAPSLDAPSRSAVTTIAPTTDVLSPAPEIASRPMSCDVSPTGPSTTPSPSKAPSTATERIDSPRDFFRLLTQSPLLFWITASTVALFLCRAGLSLQWGYTFEQQFDSDVELATFLGTYTQITLVVSVVFQLFLVSRLVGWMGLSGAQLLYAGLIGLAALGGIGGMSLMAALFARFVETELRYGLRNPVAQLTVNLFSKSVRSAVRGWSLGLLIPLATLAASIGLGYLAAIDARTVITLATLAAAAAYLGTSFGLSTAVRHPDCRDGLTPIRWLQGWRRRRSETPAAVAEG